MTPADRDRIQARIRICEDALHGLPAYQIATNHRTSLTKVRQTLRTAGWPNRAAVATHIDTLVYDRSQPDGCTWDEYVAAAVTRWLNEGTPVERVVAWLGYSDHFRLARALRDMRRDDLAAAVHPGRRDAAA